MSEEAQKDGVYGYFLIKNELSTDPNTHAIVIRNAGRIAAKNVRVGHNKFTGLSCTVYPPIEYQTKEIEGGIELFFPILG